MAEPMIGIIGGSGLYDMEGLTHLREERVTTPFGDPSDAYILGRLDGHPVAFLARHGRGHRLLPSELNFRANIYGFKALDVQWIISASAVGSMREEIRPLDIVVPDQFFDRTKARASTFFGDGLVAHVSFADPVCPHLGELLYGAGTGVGATMHKGGDLSLYGGPTVLDAGRVPHLPGLGSRHHRDDQSARGKTQPRGGDLLCDHGPRHRLRRLARGGRGCDGGEGDRHPAQKCGYRQGHHPARRPDDPAGAVLRLLPGAQRCHHHPPRTPSQRPPRRSSGSWSANI